MGTIRIDMLMSLYTMCTPLNCFKPLWTSFYYWKQKKIFRRISVTRQLMDPIDFHSRKKNTFNCWFAIFSIIFNRRKKFIQVWGRLHEECTISLVSQSNIESFCLSNCLITDPLSRLSTPQMPKVKSSDVKAKNGICTCLEFVLCI